jgi:hypothetical protein
VNESDEHKKSSAGVSVLDQTLKLSDKIPWTVTVRGQWIEKGILIIPPRLAEYLKGTNTTHIIYDDVDEVLPYEEENSCIEGFGDFYCAKDIAEGEKICLQLRGLEPTCLFVCRSW